MKKAIVYPGWLSCVINRNLCQRVRDYLIQNEYELTASIKNAHLIIYAGCAVTEDTELQSLSELSYIEETVLKNNSEQKIVLIGCFPKMNKKTRGAHYSVNGEYREGVVGEQYKADINSQFIAVDLYDYSILDQLIEAKVSFDSIPFPSQISSVHGVEGVNFSFGSMKGFDKEKTRKMQQTFLKQVELQSNIASKGFLFPTSGEILSVYGYKQIMIGQGCKNNCAYCAIKFAKTKIKSIPYETLISQIKVHISHGETKFMLLCDDLRSWGLDIKMTWIDLLKGIIEIDCKDLKIALFNLKVEDLLEEKVFFNDITDTGKVTYIGLMGQHVNKRILTAMKRTPFDKLDFLKLINEYGAKNVHIHTYNIIGFPGETEEEFLELIDFVGGIETENFSLLNFPYSERKGTLAQTYPDKVSYEIIMERDDRINLAYYECSKKRFSRMHSNLRDTLCDLIKLQVDQRELYYNYSKFLAELV